jgi:hypothetical protein
MLLATLALPAPACGIVKSLSGETCIALPSRFKAAVNSAQTSPILTEASAGTTAIVAKPLLLPSPGCAPLAFRAMFVLKCKIAIGNWTASNCNNEGDI